MTRTGLLAAALAAAALPALAEDAVTYTVNEPFEDVTFAVESAIVGQGLVIDNTSHVGEMLERTKGDVGGDETLYTGADVFSFCSATVSREVMEADITLIRYCPYGIFVYATPGAPDQTTVGYRSYPDGPMDAVEAMLDAIVKEALGL